MSNWYWLRFWQFFHFNSFIWNPKRIYQTLSSQLFNPTVKHSIVRTKTLVWEYLGFLLLKFFLSLTCSDTLTWSLLRFLLKFSSLEFSYKSTYFSLFLFSNYFTASFLFSNFTMVLLVEPSVWQAAKSSSSILTNFWEYQ